MRKQKKALKWKELENGDLFAVEAIKPKEGNLKFGLAFRIWFHNTDGENCQRELKYWISIYYFDTASVRNFRTDSLKGAKELCDLYGKSYFDSLIENKIIEAPPISNGTTDSIKWKAITIGDFPAYRGEAVDTGIKVVFIVQQVADFGAWKIKISYFKSHNEYIEHYKMTHTFDEIKSWCEDWYRELFVKENES